jgi:hypothetical protein
LAVFDLGRFCNFSICNPKKEISWCLLTLVLWCLIMLDRLMEHRRVGVQHMPAVLPITQKAIRIQIFVDHLLNRDLLQASYRFLQLRCIVACITSFWLHRSIPTFLGVISPCFFPLPIMVK